MLCGSFLEAVVLGLSHDVGSTHWARRCRLYTLGTSIGVRSTVASSPDESSADRGVCILVVAMVVRDQMVNDICHTCLDILWFVRDQVSVRIVLDHN